MKGGYGSHYRKLKLKASGKLWETAWCPRPGVTCAGVGGPGARMRQRAQQSPLEDGPRRLPASCVSRSKSSGQETRRLAAGIEEA